ncbi:hypothetical protein Pcinc_016336 [Petrolisthes cinctipes]|uniref:Uncharacterized protein n=1 Tax=Petrolisthes cinctipes TaxID=88211 RepID=A0AAE1KPU4_PETCI|nr:hypothetical protein Pcinc_016336 [Petrolisthes cinctipes]
MNFEATLESIKIKRQCLAQKREALQEEQRRRQEERERQVGLAWVVARNDHLIQEVQREAAKLRTLHSSPLLAHLQKMRIEYLRM